MTPPTEETPKQSDPKLLVSFRIMGVNTRKLLKRIKEEGKDVWLDER